MKSSLIVASLVLSCVPASAQNKHDIRGLYPGMTAAEALTVFKAMDCKLFASAEYEFAPACIYQWRGYLKNEGLYAYFARSLPEKPIWAVVLTFGSVLNREEISETVSQQFHVKFGPNDIAKPEDDHFRVDIGGGLMLRLAPERGNFVQGYRLSLWSEPLRVQQDRAETADAIPKF